MSKLLPFNLFVRQALLHPLVSPFLPPPIKVLKDFSYANGKQIGLLDPAGMGGTARTGQTISYANYDDGWFEKGYPLSGPRFTDNENGTVTDNATGLMWAKDGQGAGCYNGGSIRWAQALTYAEGLTFAEYTDWRVPNIKELLSIVDFSKRQPAIDEIFVNTEVAYYWSSTTYIGITAEALIIYFYWGWINWQTKTDRSNLRLVRDA